MTSSKIKAKNKFGYIRFRLVGAYLGIIVLALMFISTYVLTSISQYLYNQNQVELLANANVVANMVSEYVEDDKDIIPVTVFFDEVISVPVCDISHKVVVED